jgi:hypothetical protein
LLATILIHWNSEVKALRGTLTIIVFALLLSLPVFGVRFPSPAEVVRDPDVWWHLQAGNWIVAHSAVPQVDPFSTARGPGPSLFGQAGEPATEANVAAAKDGTTGEDQRVPWVDYSWAAQLILHSFYGAFGLRGLVVYTSLMTFSILFVFFLMVRRMQPSLLVSAALTLAMTLGVLRVATPRPWLFTILFFMIELCILLEAGRTARPRLLLLLVPLFWAWANMHIQFTFGLLVLAIAVAEPLLARRIPLALDRESTTVSASWMFVVFLLCCGATLLNPYHVRVYATAMQLLGEADLRNVISEVQSIPFRSIADWIVLAAALGGAAAIASRRPVRLLLVLIFPLVVYLSFRSRRDEWMTLIVGLLLVASASRGHALTPTRLSLRSGLCVAAIVTAFALGCMGTLNEPELESYVARSYPVKAVAFLRRGSFDGPLYNTYNWGGFLIFHYPEQEVSMDGRTLIHGAGRVIRNTKMQDGIEGWQNDPELSAAKLVIVPRKDSITLLLRTDPRFRIVYEDEVAVVFGRR